MTTTYAKRYTRLEKPRNHEITKRFVLINSEICRRGLIRKDELHDLFPDIPQRPFDQITSNLFHNGFAARPHQQQELHQRVPGSLPMFFTPDRRGTQLHSAFFADPVTSPKYTQENDHMTWGYMRHQHTTTSTLIKYQTKAIAEPDVTFLPEPELWSRFAPNAKLNQPIFDIDEFPTLMAHDFINNPPELKPAKWIKTPLQITARLDWDIHIPGDKDLKSLTLPVSTQPDGYFALHKTKPNFFFFESDEGTETILPRQDIRQSMQLFTDTSLFAKYLTYIAAFRKRSHQKQFGIQSFKVITVTTTRRRVDEMIKKLAPRLMSEPLNIHSDFLLFTDRETLESYDNNPYHPDHFHKNLLGENVHILSL